MAEKTAMMDVQALVASARKRIEVLEKGLLEKGRAQQRELGTRLKGLRDGKSFKALEQRASGLSEEIRSRVDGLQGKILLAMGVASHSEIEEIHRDLTKLSKTVEELAIKKNSPTA